MLRLALLSLLAAVPLTAQAPKPKWQIDKKDLRAILDAQRKEQDVPALGAAVVTSRGLVELAVVGVRKRGDETKVEETDRFHLGSDTKAMTALLCAILVEKKQLSYDRTLPEAFPEMKGKLPAGMEKVTLHQLLAHTSGLPANIAWEKIPVRGGTMLQREQVVRGLEKVKMDAKPGEKFIYSNLGYALAGAMAERATKKPWEEMLTAQVFEPLRMTRVGFGPPGTKGKVEQPLAHSEKGRPIEPGPGADNPPVLGPAGTVHSALADWAKFLADELKGSQGKDGLVKGAAYKKLFEVDKGSKYTIGGWGVLGGSDGKVLLHDGSNGNNYATAVIVPSIDLAVLVVCNQGGKKGKEAAVEAREAILEKLLPKD